MIQSGKMADTREQGHIEILNYTRVSYQQCG